MTLLMPFNPAPFDKNVAQNTRPSFRILGEESEDETTSHPPSLSDHFTALMAVCCSKSDKEEKLVKCSRVLVNKGARVNAHDR